MNTLCFVCEKPIIFSEEMVQAALDGRKTQTRRVIKPQPAFDGSWRGCLSIDDLIASPHDWSPYGKPGDLLWMRETLPFRWVPSIHMPRWASHITLRVTDIMVERVQDITRLECYREGWPCDERQLDGVYMADAGLDDANIDDASIEWFANLWESINAKRGYGWESNPWVWVVEFETHQRNTATSENCR